MKYWRFMDYCTDDTPSRNLIRDWLLEHDEGVQADFINVLNLLERQANWDGQKQIRPLRKKHTGLWEIRFNVTTTERQHGPFWRYRPVGFMGPQARQFILLLGCKKWMQIYTPLECFDLALELMEKFYEGKGTICEHVI